VTTSGLPIDFAAVQTLAMSIAVKNDIGLLATFIGIGIVVNVLIGYIVVLALGERRANSRGRERRPGADATRTSI
jgi:hypothetical protein